MGAIEHPPIFAVPGVPHHVLYTWIAMVIILVVSVAATRRLDLVPRGLQNFMELVMEQFVALLDDVIGHEGRRYLPLIATLGLFILVSNLLGLIPGLMAPTGNLNTTAACAIIVFITYHVIGARKVGLVPYLKHFAGPLLGAELFPNKVVDVAFKAILVPLFFVIEIFSHLARPLSLALRLFGNMAGGHILLAVMFLLTLGMIGWTFSGTLGAIGLGVPGSLLLIAFTSWFLFPLKLLVAFLQAFIFCMLSMLYIAGAVQEAEHH
ncbi:MAG TPA: F0F1 ATP synthase subunit A [Methylomirabilota bacterium]|jgi:F-type H+-transporting ATPase subunit a|nr:F0F1 ATP synthase subunit A [Methylomirabilota bacterium]